MRRVSCTRANSGECWLPRVIVVIRAERGLSKPAMVGSQTVYRIQ
ncbi:Uncharacterised protein [Bordetella pertussis]|nr:Uncharacterised protein [Bordetella pertussis]